jgi:Fe2+ transport system protein FeoA
VQLRSVCETNFSEMRRELFLQFVSNKPLINDYSRMKITTLSQLKDGQEARIVALRHDSQGMIARLNHLGLSAGLVVTIVAGGKGADFLVKVGDSRIALEPSLAEAITVQTGEEVAVSCASVFGRTLQSGDVLD